MVAVLKRAGRRDDMQGLAMAIGFMQPRGAGSSAPRRGQVFAWPFASAAWDPPEGSPLTSPRRPACNSVPKLLVTWPDQRPYSWPRSWPRRPSLFSPEASRSTHKGEDP